LVLPKCICLVLDLSVIFGDNTTSKAQEQFQRYQQRTLRKTYEGKYSQGQVDASQLNTLMSDLHLNWDEAYPAKKFPLAKNFLSKIDPEKK
jgi:hypothetical protein